MKSINRYHRRVTEWLSQAGISYMEEYPVGRWSLDVWLPEFRLGLEIDGPSHSWVKDKERDEKILDTYGIPIIRIPVGSKKKLVMDTILKWNSQ